MSKSAVLGCLFGQGWRGMLAAARGEDDSPVETAEEDARSYSQQETFARDVADRICYLEGGRIIEEGDPATILSEPVRPETRAFLDRVIRAGRL